MRQIDTQDLIANGLLGLSFAAMGLFKAGDIIGGFQSQSLVSNNAKATAQDNVIAQRRFSEGCNTGFLVDGKSSITTENIAIDIRLGTPLGKGTVLCDETGATAILDQDGIPSDIRVSAVVRRRYHEQKFRDENKKTLQGEV